MRMTASGTLLMPVATTGSSTIVPVGALVETLGYRLEWVLLMTKQLDLRSVEVAPNSRKSLDLISRIEDKRLADLHQAVTTTEDRVHAAALKMSQSWFSMLVEYCAKSDFNEGLKAMDKAPFLQGVP